VMEATIMNNNNLRSPIEANGAGPTSLGSGVIMLGYLNSVTGSTNTDHFGVFDNIELIDLESVAFTSMAIAGGNVYLNFCSHLSQAYNPSDFRIMETSDLGVPFSSVFSVIWNFTNDLAGRTAYFGAVPGTGFSTTNSKFFTIGAP
jgi:hypothetical protein